MQTNSTKMRISRQIGLVQARNEPYRGADHDGQWR
jgi:hypothetical protein